jgi:transposase
MSSPKNHKLPYPPEFRQQMVKLAKAGRRANELAKEFGCHETSIAGWVARAASGAPSLSNLPPTLHESERAELVALRKENRQIKMERDILAKAGPSLQTKAIRHTRHLHVDRRKSGQAARPNQGCSHHERCH